MISIGMDEFEHLERIRSGLFGTVYKKNNEIAYKIYHPTIPDEFGHYHTNPTLKLSKRRFERLIERSKHLKNTGGVFDTLSLNGHFGGVVIPYYDGKRLNEMLDEPLSLRIDLSKKIVENAKELTSFYIYPFDYKLNNIMCVDKEIRIIDIDDKHTHVTPFYNPFYRAYSIEVLGETIQAFLRDHRHLYVPKEVDKQLGRVHPPISFTYHSLNQYLDKKEIVRDILWIDNSTDLESIPNMIQDMPLSVVYVLDDKLSDEDYKRLFESCRDKGIPLYDIALQSYVSDYSNFENVGEEFVTHHKELYKK